MRFEYGTQTSARGKNGGFSPHFRPLRLRPPISETRAVGLGRPASAGAVGVRQHRPVRQEEAFGLALLQGLLGKQVATTRPTWTSPSRKKLKRKRRRTQSQPPQPKKANKLGFGNVIEPVAPSIPRCKQWLIPPTHLDSHYSVAFCSLLKVVLLVVYGLLANPLAGKKLKSQHPSRMHQRLQVLNITRFCITSLSWFSCGTDMKLYPATSHSFGWYTQMYLESNTPSMFRGGLLGNWKGPEKLHIIFRPISTCSKRKLGLL